jgi:hypothetical protein
MALMNEVVWRGQIYSGGQVTVRGDIALYPF